VNEDQGVFADTPGKTPPIMDRRYRTCQSSPPRLPSMV
jgi:hypothetical protein